MVDLTERKHQEEPMDYIDAHEVLVLAMAPVCGPFGPLGQLSKHIHPESWQRSYEEVAHLAIFRCKVALTQLRMNRRFIQEQPHPTKLYDGHPWSQVRSTRGVVQQVYDRCTCGLKVTSGPYKRML